MPHARGRDPRQGAGHAVGPGHRLMEVRFGNWPAEATLDGGRSARRFGRAGRPPQVEAGGIAYLTADGGEGVLWWDDAAHDPGWCKLDWVDRGRDRRRLANASEHDRRHLGGARRRHHAARRLPGPVLPGGLPRDRVASRCSPGSSSSLGADAVADYVEQLERRGPQVHASGTPNYGKAARRLYNVFRLTGRYARGGLHPRAVRRARHGALPGRRAAPDARRGRRGDVGDADAFDTEAIVAEFDSLIMSSIAALDGAGRGGRWSPAPAPPRRVQPQTRERGPRRGPRPRPIRGDARGGCLVQARARARARRSRPISTSSPRRTRPS